MARIAIVADYVNRRNLRKQRVFRDRQNPLDHLSDAEVLRNYRFTRQTIFLLTDAFAPDLEHPTRRNYSLSSQLQLLIGLRFFATGAPHHVFAEMFGVERSTISRVITDVIRVLVSKAADYIVFPTDGDSLRTVKQQFYQLCNIPNVIGALDCTHVRLSKAPLKESEPLYVNRKRWHSINTQIICDANYKITNIVARWPGSVHDCFIFTSSSIGQMCENAGENGIGCLLGDRGYYQRPWLMTPYEDPTTVIQRNYNRAHRRGRVLIEQVNGQLKQKFPCLVYGLRIKPEKACSVILACAVLYNISKNCNEPIHDDVPDNELRNDVEGDNGNDGHGLLHRDMFVNNYFA